MWRRGNKRRKAKLFNKWDELVGWLDPRVSSGALSFWQLAGQINIQCQCGWVSCKTSKGHFHPLGKGGQLLVNICGRGSHTAASCRREGAPHEGPYIMTELCGWYWEWGLLSWIPNKSQIPGENGTQHLSSVLTGYISHRGLESKLTWKQKVFPSIQKKIRALTLWTLLYLSSRVVTGLNLTFKQTDTAAESY